MAAIDFYINTTGYDYNLDLSGSGLGFFGASGFGSSVQVGQYQGSTYATDGSASVQGASAGNIKYTNAGSGIIAAGASGVGLQVVPNHKATVNVRFTHTTPVKVQNCEMRIYDRYSINNPASGVTTKVAEIIHPDVLERSYSGVTLVGSGDDQWHTPKGSGVVVSFANSPGSSGFYAGNGTSASSVRSDKRHDWYAAISSSPDSIGNKTKYGLYFAVEYI